MFKKGVYIVSMKIQRNRFLSNLIPILIFLFSLNGAWSQTPVSILMVLGDAGFDDMQYIIATARIEAAGYKVETASSAGKTALSLKGNPVAVDYPLSAVKEKNYLSMLVLGGTGVRILEGNASLASLSRSFDNSGKIIGALEYAPAMLSPILSGREVSLWPTDKKALSDAGGVYKTGLVALSRNLITGIGGSDENDTVFILAYLEALRRVNPAQKAIEKEIALTFNKEGTRFVMTHAGVTRTGALHIPALCKSAGSDAEKKYSLVYALHGTAGTGEDFRNRGFDKIADELDFIMMYPDGYNGDWDIIPGGSTSFDEAGFFRALTEEMEKKYPVDPKRVYATGFSLGSFMVYRLACDLPYMFAAIAPVSGLLYPPRTGLPLPKKTSLLHIHARDDRNVPFNGDPMYGIPVSVEASVALWRESAGAAPGGKSVPSPVGSISTKWSAGDPSSKSGPVDIVMTEYFKGGHFWQSGTTEQIADFFFNHPGRGKEIRINFAEISPYAELAKPISLAMENGSLAGINKIVYCANGAEITEAVSKPFSAVWVPQKEGSYRLTAYAVLDDGETLRSTLNRTILVSKPDLVPQVSSPGFSSSSIESDILDGARAFDGDPSTRWASLGADPQWIQADLGRTVTLSAITLIWEAAYALSYEIQYSADGVSWKTAYVTDSCSGGTEFISFEPVEARFVRMYGKSRATKWGYSLWDILLHGSLK